MNKIILFSRPGLGLNSDEIQGIFSAMAESGFDWAANDEFAREAHDKAGVEIPAEKRYASIDAGLARGAVMLSYGGDGTFLEAVKLAYGCGVPVLGINYGHLGFLANTPREDMREVVGILRRGEYRIQPRTMLHVSGLRGFRRTPLRTERIYHPPYQNQHDLRGRLRGRGEAHYLPRRRRTPLYPDRFDRLLAQRGRPHRGPMCECFIIAPIAPHNLTMRPMVIPDSSVVSFRVNSRALRSSVSLDNRSFDIPCGSEFTVRKAEKPIFLINLQNISFYDTLRNKMMWGLDSWEGRK